MSPIKEEAVSEILILLKVNKQTMFSYFAVDDKLVQIIYMLDNFDFCNLFI